MKSWVNLNNLLPIAFRDLRARYFYDCERIFKFNFLYSPLPTNSVSIKDWLLKHSAVHIARWSLNVIKSQIAARKLLF